MNRDLTVRRLRNEMEQNLKECILPFWRTYVPDDVHGGFYGRVDGRRKPDLTAPKSVVLNCRILWTFSRAYEAFGEERDRQLAKRAYDYLLRYFRDEIYHGVYWMVTCKGEPSEMEKRTYGQAFFIYAMAEYYRVFQEPQALFYAMETFRLVERSLKRQDGGYADSVSRDWLQDDWVNIWVKNRAGAPKLLNSNMHLFEAILALAQVNPMPETVQSLRKQLIFLVETAMDETAGHMKAGMSETGDRLDGEINYGHDCECAYLMMEAAVFLQEERLLARTEQVVETILKQVYQSGLDPVNGGMYYLADLDTHMVNRSKIWWVQAEGITAFFDGYQRFGEEKYLKAAENIWDYIHQYMVNHELGEWYSIGKNPVKDEALQEQERTLSAVFTNEEMAGKGKCPYHNSRACFEMIKRTEMFV